MMVIDNYPVCFVRNTMNENQDILDKFGKVIISGFKDNPLIWFDNWCNGEVAVDADIVRHKELSKLSKYQIDFIRDCIIRCLTLGIHDFLHQLTVFRESEDDVHLIINGVDLFNISDGLNYEQFSEDGWDARFSKYPSSDEIEEKYRKIFKEKYSGN